LTTKHINNRLLFANKMLGYDFSRVVFSDEKIWRIRPGGKVRVWRRKGKRFDARYTTKTTQQSVGVMVWCAINSKGEICLRRCPELVNAAAYQSILGTALNFIKGSSRCVKCILVLDSFAL
jgi:hypothetical protein